MKYKTTGHCEACEYIGNLDIHHIRSRKSGGKDEPSNLMNLCRVCHTEIHDIGRNTFITKYNLTSEMEARGWWFCQIQNKWKIEYRKYGEL